MEKGRGWWAEWVWRRWRGECVRCVFWRKWDAVFIDGENTLPHLQTLKERSWPSEMEEDPREWRSQPPTDLATFSRFHTTSSAKAWAFPVVRLRFRVEGATSCDNLGVDPVFAEPPRSPPTSLKNFRVLPHTLFSVPHTLFFVSHTLFFVFILLY